MLVPHVRHEAGGPQAQLEPDEKHHGKERAAQLVVVPHLPHQLGIADHVSVVPHQLEHQAQCDHNEHRLWVLFLEPFFRLGAKDRMRESTRLGRFFFLLLVVGACSGRG